MLDSDGGALLGSFEGHLVTEYRPEVQMTLSKVFATCEKGSVIAWDLLSQKVLGRIPIRDDIPTASFDLFENGLVAAAGSKLFMRSTG